MHIHPGKFKLRLAGLCYIEIKDANFKVEWDSKLVIIQINYPRPLRI